MALSLRKSKINAVTEPVRKNRPKVNQRQALKRATANRPTMRSNFQPARAKNTFQPERSNSTMQPGPVSNNPAVANAGDPAQKYSPGATMTGTQLRNEAAREWRDGNIDINRRLYEAALAWGGDTDAINKYAGLLGVQAPTDLSASASATIARERERAGEDLGRSMNSQNTFFSGIHGRGQKDLSDEAARSLASAFEVWRNTEQAGMQDQESLRERFRPPGTYGPDDPGGTAYSEALMADIEADLERGAEPAPLVAPLSPASQQEIKQSQTKAKKKIANQAKKKKPAMASAWGR